MAEPTASPNPGAAGQRWQAQADLVARGRGDRRRRWLIVLTALLLALASSAVVWFLLMRPAPAPPFLVTIDIGDLNARQYPVLAFARQDGKRLGRHFPQRKQAETKTRELLLSELNGLASRTEPLIVTISALALVRQDAVYLVPGDANPDDEATLLDVRQVIDALGRCPARHKLLILDLAHPMADPRLGILTDRVAQTLEHSLSAEPPAFFVLCPASAGQVSLVSEILPGSVLAYYIDQGLGGAADADNDLRVTVEELFAFVQPHVERWARLNRGVQQRPRLFGKADDFVLAGVGKNAPAPLERPALAAYPPALLDGWKKRDRWRDEGALRRAPRLLMRLEANLVRQEALWRGGAALKEDWAAFDDDLAARDRDFTRATLTPPLPARSRALALAQKGATRDPALVESVQPFLAAARDLGGKKDARAAAALALGKKLHELKDVDALVKADAILAALDRSAELRPEALLVAQDVLGPLYPNPPFAELVGLRRLSEFAERVQARDPDSWPAEKAQAMLQALIRREQVLAALSQRPGLLEWAGPTVAAGDVLRRRGEKQLLWERPSSWADALTALRSALERYKEAADTLDNARRGQHSLDRAFADLPGFAALVRNWPDFDAQAEAAWRDAAREAHTLERLFAERASNQPPPLREMDTHSRAVERHLDALDKRLARRVTGVKKGVNGVALTQALALLETPLPRAPERLALFEKQRALAAALQGQTDELDQDESRSVRANVPAGLPGPDAEVGLERLRMSLDLLRLAGVAKDGAVLEPAGRLSSEEWTRLERAVHGLWAHTLVAKWQAATTPAASDALDRLVPPWELDRRTGDAREAHRLLYLTERELFVRWVAEGYQADAVALEASGRDGQAAAFFRESARELRLAASEQGL